MGKKDIDWVKKMTEIRKKYRILIKHNKTYSRRKIEKLLKIIENLTKNWEVGEGGVIKNWRPIDEHAPDENEDKNYLSRIMKNKKKFDVKIISCEKRGWKKKNKNKVFDMLAKTE